MPDTIQPFHLIGSKWNIAPIIISYMSPHTCYVEAFGGTLSVLLQKYPSKVEVANDINQDIINFFLQLRDNYNTLIWKLQFTPYSREYHRQVLSRWKEKNYPSNPVERAAQWFFLIQATIDGTIGSGFSTTPLKNHAKTYQDKVQNLHKVADRLKNVIIENLDFEEIIKRYDGPNTLVFSDPPYLTPRDRSSEYYTETFTIDDHIRLSKLLNQIKGKAILSYYPHPIIDELYKGWYRIEINTLKHSMVTEVEGSKEEAIELLLFNYEPMPLFR